ncbi:MAG TPA: glycosyltransferase family 4 protein [Gemmatimonadales bacterium]|nr:glycosyltransferase family 4 protein [Gemmatimonadales bacterium]
MSQTPAQRRILLMESNEDHTVGGSYQALFDLATGLDRAQFHPVVLFNQANLFVPRLQAEGIEVHLYESERAIERAVHRNGNRLLKLREMARAIGRRRQFISTHAIDLVHLNNHPVFTCDDWLPAAHLEGIPCIVNAMGEAPEEHSRVKRFLVRRYDRVIAISEHMRSRMRHLGIADERITTVYLGLDAAAYRARVDRRADEVRREAGVAPGAILAVMVGNIRPWKGQHVVLSALAQLPIEVRGRLRVLFVGATAPGEVEYEAALRQTVAREGLEGIVQFVGARRDVPDFVNAADICLHASVTPEPFGLVILEAMALGKPLLAAACGGPAEILTPESGVLFDPERPEQLTAALARLVPDEAARACLGRAARERVTRFSLDRNVAGNAQVYRELLERR